MTIGTKTKSGFGLILALLTLVGLIAYFGIDDIVDDASDVIGGNQLEAMIAQREVDHLNWAAEVYSLFTDDTMTELTVETDPHDCALGQWYYSEKRDALKTSFPSFADILERMEAPHHELHASATKIGKTFQQPHEGLQEQLVEVQLQVMDWQATVSRKLGEEAGGVGKARTMLPKMIERTMGVIRQIDAQPDLTLEEKQAQALELVAAMRDGVEGYAWVQDLDARMVMNPNRPDLNGQLLGDLKDERGTRFLWEMSQKAKTHGKGFVTYFFKRPRREVASPKISYVELYEPWGWVVGTGIYIERGEPRPPRSGQRIRPRHPFQPRSRSQR